VVPPWWGGSISGMTVQSWAWTKCCDGIDIPRVAYIPTKRSCEKINNLIPQSGTKAQRLAKTNCFVFFAPSATLSRLAG
jgi:hypothetical protein